MGWLILLLSVFVYIAVAFMDNVLLCSSSHPFKIDIITFIFQVGRLGLSKFSGLQVGAHAVTTVYYSPFLQCSNPLSFCPDFLFRGLAFSLRSGVLKPYGYFAVVLVLLILWWFCCCSYFIGLRGEGHHHHPSCEWQTLFLNGLVRHMLKTAQLLNRRPYHLTWISVCFVGWFVLRQCQAPDSVLPK